MAKMHWCTCLVNLAGQGLTFTRIEKQFPVSWPEVQVLMALHGEENISEVKAVGIGDVHPPNEKDRLGRKYRYGVVEQVFPGRSFRMELLMPAETEDLPQLTTFDGVGPQRPADDDDHVGSLEPPMGAPVFKPGRVQPPKQPEP